jgi:hypothetical protein
MAKTERAGGQEATVMQDFLIKMEMALSILKTAAAKQVRLDLRALKQSDALPEERCQVVSILQI